MAAIVEAFLYPVSPILALMGGGTTLIALECLPSGAFARKVKYLVALLGVIASLVLTAGLWKAGVTLPGPLVELAGDMRWLAEFTRSYRLDTFALGLFAAIGVFTLLTLVLVRTQFAGSEVLTEILALTLFIASGMMVLVTADTLLMVFLGLELLSLPTYVLVGMRRRDRNSCEAALKYFLFGSFATVLFVFGIALLYGRFGTLSLPGIARGISELGSAADPDPKLVYAGIALIVTAVGFKVGLVPFHMWVPDTYQGAPATVTGFMGSAIKVAGFGLAVRVMWGMFLPMYPKWSSILGALAVLTMFAGNLAALAQDNLKRMFAYSSISHAGFLMLGVAVIPRTGPNASPLFYYLVVYGLMFLGLFALLMLIERAKGNADIFQVSGMGFTHPLMGLCLALFALSGAGIPPTAGFFGKYFVFLQGVEGGQTPLVVAALIASLLGAYYYLRVVVYLYMKDSKELMRLGLRQDPYVAAVILFCAASLLVFAIFPHWLTVGSVFIR